MADQDLISDLQTLMAEFTRSGLMTLHVRHAHFELLLSNDPGVGSFQRSSPTSASVAPPSPQKAADAAPLRAAAASPRAEFDLPADAIIVRAPNLGTFYRAPKPGAENYVEIGSVVAEGEELCLIEVMKLFTAVRSEHAGRIHAVLAEDGSMVESGQPLFALVAG